jgi:hypothetical protein
MKTRTIIGYLTSITLLVTVSCECLSTDESISPIIDTELPETTTVGTTVSFKVFHVVFNGCGEYARQVTTRDDRTITVRFYGKYPSCKMCPDNIPTLETVYTFPALEQGDFYFKFYQDNFDGQEFILDTLTVQ